MVGATSIAPSSPSVLGGEPAPAGSVEALYCRVSDDGVIDDLVLLDKADTSAQAIAEVLRNRYANGDMYTAIGPVLISVNPYQPLDRGGRSIYDTSVGQAYRNGDDSRALAPHIFRTAADAMRSLVSEAKPQCIVITGESGSGKTETAKHIIKFATESATARRLQDGSGCKGRTVRGSVVEREAEEERIERQLLESGPVLEAFGNARTSRNDNSSRFGKYLELQLSFAGQIIGGRVTNYLLEKTRVTTQAQGERNFHIFHYLLAGTPAKERSLYGLLTHAPTEGLPPSSSSPSLDSFIDAHRSGYAYMPEDDGGRNPQGIPGVDDGLQLARVKQSLSRMGVGEEEQAQVWGLLGGLLALGNVEFEDHGDDKRATVKDDPEGGARDPEALARAAGALGVDACMLQRALTMRTLMAGEGNFGFGANKKRTIHVRNLNREDSLRNRDTLAKEAYKRVFDWIIARVNGAIGTARGTQGQGGWAGAAGGSHHSDSDLSHGGSDGDLELPPGGSDRELSLGILDIYGFEIFEVNGFEQFCINYVNEKLQQFFIAHSLKAEQEDYRAEGVEWVDVEFFNNKVVCDMIESRQGMLPLLNELGNWKGSDEVALVNRYNREMKKDKYCAYYLVGKDVMHGEGQAAYADKSKQYLDMVFGVRHYAGDVGYYAGGWLEKNADTLFNDVLQVMSESEKPVIAALFDCEERSFDERARRPPSTATQFTKQVQELCESLALCEPRFVRCIKPNDRKVPSTLDLTRVLHQAEYLGLQENVRIRQAGFVHRMTYDSFVRRYSLLSSASWPDRVPEEDTSPPGVSPPGPNPPGDKAEQQQEDEDRKEPQTASTSPSQSEPTSEQQQQKKAQQQQQQQEQHEEEKDERNAAAPPPPATPTTNSTDAHYPTPPAAPAPRRLVWRPCTLPHAQAARAIVLGQSSKQWPTYLTGGKELRLGGGVAVGDTAGSAGLVGEAGEQGGAAVSPTGDAAVFFGKTKVLFKRFEPLARLEEARTQALFPVVTLLQKNIRGLVQRRAFSRMQTGAIKLHGVVRGFIQRRRYEAARGRVVKRQAVVRGKQQRDRYREMRERFKGVPPRCYALKVQRLVRGILSRQSLPPATRERTALLGQRILDGKRRQIGATAFQSAFRAHRQYCLYQGQRQGALLLQRSVRVWTAWKRREALMAQTDAETFRQLHSGAGLPALKHAKGKLGVKKAQVALRVTAQMGPKGKGGGGGRSCHKALTWSGGSSFSRGRKGLTLGPNMSVSKGPEGGSVFKLTAEACKGEEVMCGKEGGVYVCVQQLGDSTSRSSQSTAVNGAQAQQQAKTLDLEMTNTHARDSLVRVLNALVALESG